MEWYWQIGVISNLNIINIYYTVRLNNNTETPEVTIILDLLLSNISLDNHYQRFRFFYISM